MPFISPTKISFLLPTKLWHFEETTVTVVAHWGMIPTTDDLIIDGIVNGFLETRSTLRRGRGWAALTHSSGFGNWSHHGKTSPTHYGTVEQSHPNHPPSFHHLKQSSKGFWKLIRSKILINWQNCDAMGQKSWKLSLVPKTVVTGLLP